MAESIPGSCRRNIQLHPFPPLDSSPSPCTHTHLWDPLQSQDTPKFSTCWTLEPKCNLQQLSTFSIISKVHGGCVRQQWAQVSWAHCPPTAHASIELQFHTVCTVDLPDFVFGHKWRGVSPAGHQRQEGQDSGVQCYCSSFCLHKVSQQTEEELNLCVYIYE